LLHALSEVVPVPVIASGGVGSPEDMYRGVVEGQADAVLAASIFHFGAYSVADVKAYLAERGVPVRGFVTPAAA
jgi:cyclase